MSSYTYEREIDITGDNNISNNNYSIDKYYQREPASAPPMSENLLNEINKLKKIKSRVKSLEQNEYKINQIENDVKENNEKIEQLSRTMNEYKNRSDEINRSAISQSLEYDKLVQENITLKADTLIFREDIQHLSALNKQYEDELTNNRKKMLELINVNDSYQNEIAQKDMEISRLTEAITRLRLFDNPDAEFTIENRSNKLQKIKELEFDNKKLLEENVRMKTEYRILNERYNELQRTNEQLQSELKYTKQQEAEQMNLMEDKIKQMEVEFSSIQQDNVNLKISNEQNQKSNSNILSEKESLEAKYSKKKQQVKDLNKKLNDLENHIKQIEYEKGQLLMEKEKCLRGKSRKDNDKQKLLNELQNKIQSFKTHVMNHRNQNAEED